MAILGVVLLPAGAAEAATPGPAEGAGNLAGDAVVVGVSPAGRGGPVRAFVRSRGGRFSGPVSLSSGASSRGAVPRSAAVGAGGEMVVAWQTGRRLWVASRPPGGRFGAPQALGSIAGLSDFGEAEDVALDVNARGDAVLAWEGKPSPPGRQTVVVSTRRGNGPFSPPVELVRGASSFDAGTADDGEVLVAVTVPEGDGSAAEVMRGTVGEPAFTRRRVEGLTGIEDLTVAGDGSALLAGVTARGELVVVRRRPDGSLTATDLVAQRSADGGAAVAGGPTGDGVAVWRDYSSDRREASLLVRPFGPEGFWPIERLGVSDYEPALARTGAATAIAWRQPDDVMLGFVGPGGRLASPRVVDRARRGATFEPGAPPVLIPGPGDRATVVFERSNGARVSLLAREVGPGSVGPRLTLASNPTFVREAPRRACFPKGMRVVVRTSEVVVTDYDGEEPYEACLLSRGVPIPIEGEQGDSRVLGPPALAVGGPLVAYAVVECGPLDCFVKLVVEDLRSKPYGRRRVFSWEDDAMFDGVVAMRVSPRGDVAWIDCSECASRSVAAVWALAVTDTEPKQLENGRGIAPRSLKIDGTTVRWRRNGRQRSASLR